MFDAGILLPPTTEIYVQSTLVISKSKGPSEIL